MPGCGPVELSWALGVPCLPPTALPPPPPSSSSLYCSSVPISHGGESLPRREPHKLQPEHWGRRTRDEVDPCGLLQVFAKGGPDFSWDLEDSAAWEVWSWSGQGGKQLLVRRGGMESRLDRLRIKVSGYSRGGRNVRAEPLYCIVVYIE